MRSFNRWQHYDIEVLRPLPTRGGLLFAPAVTFSSPYPFYFQIHPHAKTILIDPCPDPDGNDVERMCKGKMQKNYYYKIIYAHNDDR